MFPKYARRRPEISSARHITRDTLDLLALQKPQGHKYDHGHALVLTGGPGQTGAARLAARAALRIGAGAVTLGVQPAAQMEVAVQITAIMLRRVADEDALCEILQDRRINAMCLGPALGTSEDKAALIARALKSGRACVLDADALTHLGSNPWLFDLLHDTCVLTPHAGEFLRMFPDISISTPETGVKHASDRAGCTVLLKGAQTTIGCPDGSVSVHQATGTRAVPWLATAGAGDVLAGIITGLLARGMDPLKAAETATFLHVECARQIGPGLIAEDLSEVLPAVLRDLLS